MAKMSFRDPSTQVLKAVGYMESNDPGDVSQEEADDFALEPRLWQWDGDAWIAYTADAVDVDGFLAVLKASMTIEAANALMAQYPTFYHLMQAEDWANAADIVIAAHDAIDINDTLYTLVLETAIDFHVPLDLPPL